MSLIDDCEQFVLRFFDVIEKSAMHIYHSALPWSPTLSPIRNLYQMQMTTEVKLVNAIDTNWGACIRIIPFHRRPNAIAFSHKDASLAITSATHVSALDTITGTAVFEVPQSMIQAVAFSPDDNRLVCALWDKSPDDNRLVGARRNESTMVSQIQVLDVQTSNIVQTFVGPKKKIYSVAFSPCGTMIASGGDDKIVQIWCLSSERCKCALEGHSGRVFAVCWSGTGNLVISGSGDTTVRVWDVSRQTSSMVLDQHVLPVTCVASSPGSFLFASGSQDRTVKIYDSRSGTVLQTILTGIIKSLRFSSHNDKIMTQLRIQRSYWI
jgi:WD40 repeat protein